MIEKKRTMERQNKDNQEKIKNNKVIYEQEESQMETEVTNLKNLLKEEKRNFEIETKERLLREI